MKTIKLSDLQLLFIDGDRGINYPKSSDFKKEGYCLFLDSTNVGDLGFDFGSTHFISKEKSDSMGNGKLCRYDIVITTRGSIGKVALYDESIPFDNIRINSGMLIIRASSPQEAVNVYCQLKSPYVQQQIRVFCSGSVQKQLTQPIIKDLKIYDGLSQSTSSFLINIENFLKNINNQSKELESLAKTIYDYWFLQFDFPNEEGKPYKSSGGAMEYNEQLKMDIPKGWEVRKLCEIATITTGKEDANHSSPDGKYPFFTCSHDISRCDDFKFEGKAILIAGNGDFNMKYYDGKFNAYQRTYVIMPNDDSTSGLIYLTILKNSKKFQVGSNGSIEKFIRKGDIENIFVLVPSNGANYRIFNTFLDQIQLLQKENDELSSLRDYLLPLLMNGQVGFKDE